MSNEIKGEACPVCKKKTLILSESEIEVPFFGKMYLFSMTCNECKYHKADVEAIEKKEPAKYSLEITSEADLKIRVVRSSHATVKIPHVATITPGPASNGYVTNIEGIILRIKKEIEVAKDNEEDPVVRKKAKNLLKKLNKVLWGREKLNIIVEDPSGNSAIISDKAIKTKI